MSGSSVSPRSQGWAFLFEPKHWGAAFIIPAQPLRAGWVHSDGDSHWQRTAPSQHLLLPHHSGQSVIGARPAQTPSLVTYLISKNRLSAERIHVSGPLRLAADISASLLTSFPPIPSLFFPCDFSKGEISIWNGKVGLNQILPAGLWWGPAVDCSDQGHTQWLQHFFNTVALSEMSGRAVRSRKNTALKVIQLIFNIEQKMDTMEEPWKERGFMGSRKKELPYKQLQ